MRASSFVALVVAAFTAIVSAQGANTIQINNYCKENIYIYQSTNGGCNYGWTSYWQCAANPGLCFGQSSLCNGPAWILQPQQIYYMPFIIDALGTSMKIAKKNDWSRILQFEYTVSNNIYWDISLLNGGVSGTVGTPFEHDNISMGPRNNGAGTCAWVGCIAGYPCRDAYSSPFDEATRVCPLSNNQFFINLCVGV